MVLNSVMVLLPEVLLSIFSMIIIMTGVFSKRENVGSSTLWLTVFMLIAIAIWILQGTTEGLSAFDGAFISDGLSKLFKLILLVSASVIVILSKEYLERNNLLNYEYSALITLSLVGMMMMVSATNLMSLYLGLELTLLPY